VRHFGIKLGTPKPAVFALETATSVRGSTLFDPMMRVSFVSTSMRWPARGGGRGSNRPTRSASACGPGCRRFWLCGIFCDRTCVRCRPDRAKSGYRSCGGLPKIILCALIRDC